MIKRYSELITLPTFEERFEYLSLSGAVGDDTFGYMRYLNQSFYRSTEWRNFRNHIIARDNGMDMALDGYPIWEKILIHHLNPLKVDDFMDGGTAALMNPENVVCVAFLTHQAIHYGDYDLVRQTDPVIRTPNDTSPWRR